jgi:hypothetical protein
LRVNFAKSCLLSINVLNEKAALLVGLFGCKLKTFPFNYLGLGSLYSKLNHCLTTSFLSLDARIMVTKAILSSLPTFYICTLKLTNGAIEIVEKSRRIGVWG